MLGVTVDLDNNSKRHSEVPTAGAGWISCTVANMFFVFQCFVSCEALSIEFREDTVSHRLLYAIFRHRYICHRHVFARRQPELKDVARFPALSRPL